MNLLLTCPIHLFYSEHSFLKKTREGGTQRVFQQGDAYEYPSLVKSAYRTFCAEVKVVVEIATIAAYGGLMPRKRMSLRWANGTQP